MNFLETEYYGNALLDWATTFGVIIASLVAARFVYWIFGRYIKRLTVKTRTKLDDILVDKLEEPIVALLAAFGARYAISLLAMSENARTVVANAFAMLVALIVTWGIIRVYDAIHTSYITDLVNQTETELDDQLLPILRNGVRIAVIALGIIVGLNNAGYDVGAVLAGLGIGGLAFALAAQDTVANFFGGVMLFVQQPFTLNDRIRVNDVEGYVRRVGMRSTLVETATGVRVFIPNKNFTENAIFNLDVAPFYFDKVILRLNHETTREQIDQLATAIKQISGHYDVLQWITPVLNNFGFGHTELLVKYGVDEWIPAQEPQFEMHYDKLNVARNILMREIWQILDEMEIKLAVVERWTRDSEMIEHQNTYG